MKKLVWLLALLCLAPAYYSCTTNGEAQTHTAQSSNVAAPKAPTDTIRHLRMYPAYEKFYRNPNKEIVLMFALDTQTGYRISHTEAGTNIYFRKEADTTQFVLLDMPTMVKNNPYFELPYPALNYHPNDESKTFDLRALSTQKKQDLIKGVALDKDITNQQLGYMVVSEPRAVKNYRYVAVAYDVLFLNTDSQVFGSSCQILTYNSKGEQISHIIDTKHGCASPAITENGYVGQQYGLVWDEQGTENLDFGINFYQLSDGKMLYNFKMDYTEGSAAGVGNSIYWSKGSETQVRGIIYYVFDVKNACYYTKEFNWEEQLNFRGEESEGLRMKNGSLYSFKDNFEKHSLTINL